VFKTIVADKRFGYTDAAPMTIFTTATLG